jgi:hypothetical protein
VDTVFHLWVDKKPDSLMDCEFGYENDRGEVRIDENQKYSFDYSNRKQEVYSGFSHGVKALSFYKVFARCFDVLG